MKSIEQQKQLVAMSNKVGVELIGVLTKELYNRGHLTSSDIVDFSNIVNATANSLDSAFELYEDLETHSKMMFLICVEKGLKVKRIIARLMTDLYNNNTGEEQIEIIDGIPVFKYATIEDMANSKDKGWHLECGIDAYVDGHIYSLLNNCGKLHWCLLK